MKQFIYLTLAIVLMSCSKDNEFTTPQDTVPFTFSMKGAFTISTTPMTRSLSADGKDLTDLWVLDYMNNTLVQQLHQVSTDDNFGTPTMNLNVGSHHIYFIASRGKTPTLDTENTVISWSQVSDTFYKDYTVNVVPTSNGNRTVTLDRVVTKVKFIVTDKIPEGAATANITPVKWYYGINYVSGAPADQKDNTTLSLTIPNDCIGINNFGATMFGFSTTEEWNTNINFSIKKSDDTVLGQTTIENVPFKANRSSELSGPLFGSNGAMTLTLNDVWADAYSTTW